MARQSRKKTTFKIGEDECALIFRKGRTEIVLPFEKDYVDGSLDKELSVDAWKSILIATAISSLLKEDNAKFIEAINDKMDLIIHQMVDLDTKFKEKGKNE